jgi:hypothetical protein
MTQVVESSNETAAQIVDAVVSIFPFTDHYSIPGQPVIVVQVTYLSESADDLIEELKVKHPNEVLGDHDDEVHEAGQGKEAKPRAWEQVEEFVTDKGLTKYILIDDLTTGTQQVSRKHIGALAKKTTKS